VSAKVMKTSHVFIKNNTAQPGAAIGFSRGCVVYFVSRALRVSRPAQVFSISKIKSARQWYCKARATANDFVKV